MPVSPAIKRRRRKARAAASLYGQSSGFCRTFMTYSQHDAASYRLENAARIVMPTQRERFIFCHRQHIEHSAHERRAAVADGFRLP